MITELSYEGFELKLECFKVKDSYFSNFVEGSEYSGLYYGTETKKGFIPSVIFLEELKDYDFAVINEKAEWMFLCGRDILKKSIVSSPECGKVIIKNLKNEILGMGIINNKGIKNLYDRGKLIRNQ